MPLPIWAPEPADVKAVMPARVNGQPFAEDTSPSIAEVTVLIESETSDLIAYIGHDEEVPEQWHALARKAVVYATAAEIEATFYPEQNVGDDSPAERYLTRSEARRDRLSALVGDTSPDHDARSPKGKFADPSSTTDSTYRPLSNMEF